MTYFSHNITCLENKIEIFTYDFGLNNSSSGFFHRYPRKRLKPFINDLHRYFRR